MKIILCKPTEPPSVVSLSGNTLGFERMKGLLGIDSPLNCAERKINGKTYDFWLDDEGLLKPKRLVVGACRDADEVLVGNLIIARHDKEGNTVGLTDDDIHDILLDPKGNMNFLDNDNYEKFLVYHKKEKPIKDVEGDNLIIKDYEGFGEIHMSNKGRLLRYNLK